ncbi:MAG: MFS transporter, partial [Planctomycetaceae bacterium]
IGLSETQKGEIFGAGLWPFAISIVLFSLVIDRIGYGSAMVFAFICHVLQAVCLMFATDYNTLYIGSVIGALGNGTVEAVINPVVATMFPKEKTKWLAILHAGWPGGLVIAGLFFIGADSQNITDPRILVGVIFVPVILYGILLWGRSFPVQERVQAGVSFREMLQEPGILSWSVVVALIVVEVSRVFELTTNVSFGIAAILIIPFALYVRAAGRFMFFILVLVMMPLATTELGVDSWSTELMKDVFNALGANAGWVLVYTSLIMMILRFFAGPIIHALPPLKLLALSSLVAAVGVFSLGSEAASGFTLILICATIYGLGKTFFWPAMLGVVSEQYPKGGALTLNMVSGCGMLAVGIVGGPWLGFVQDKAISEEVQTAQIAVLEDTSNSYLGRFEYKAVDTKKVEALQDPGKEKALKDIQASGKKTALRTAAILPIVMMLVYICLIAYFEQRGGYKPVELDTAPEA